MDLKEDNQETYLKKGTIELIKGAFHHPDMYCCNILDIESINKTFKVMINTNKLPEINTQEELIVLRTALDWQDRFANLAKHFKLVSKVFMRVIIINWFLVGLHSVLSAL